VDLGTPKAFSSVGVAASLPFFCSPSVTCTVVWDVLQLSAAVPGVSC
jgi:hypothetical protein